MRIKNTSDVPMEVIRDIIRLVRPPGIGGFHVIATKCSGSWRGCANGRGVTIRFDATRAYKPKRLWMYQYGQLRPNWSKPDPVTGRIYQLKGRRYYVSGFLESLIYLMAHELMHVRQGQKGGLRGRVWGARGRYSEIETEAYAIRKLREWRKSQ